VRRDDSVRSVTAGLSGSTTAPLSAPPRKATMTKASALPSATHPAVLIFDVNETLLDIEALHPLFVRVFGCEHSVREWFNTLVMYSMTVTLARQYEDFFALARGVFQMMSQVHGRSITEHDLEELGYLVRTMPAHSDVEPTLKMLSEAGFRLVTLTNSPVAHGARSPLDAAGLTRYFERQFSVDDCRAFKPSPVVYQMVAQQLCADPAAFRMVAAHVWDTIGAQSAGMYGALVTRKGNAPLRVSSLPQPHIIADELVALASRLIARWQLKP